MLLVLVGIGMMVLGGLGALLGGRSSRSAVVFGAGGAVAGSALILVPAVCALLGGPIESVRLPWNVPGGAFAVALDPVSAFFLIPTALLSALAAVYGVEYLRPFRDSKTLGPSWLCYDLLVASMAMVMIARNGVLFLIAWETMALASFFLVIFEHEQASVREAGWTYLVATHLGTACLLAMFVLLGGASGTLDFHEFPGAVAAAPGLAGPLFLLAVIGFGTKAGFIPLHVWLPEAHPAAPSHVSAVMSGVMIKTGIYGLVRALEFLGPPQAWWGWVLIGIGATSGILGVLFALAQHDLKRLLAYHSVENIGIITLGLGLGTLGVAFGSPALAVLGFGGGLLHVINHALFKGLLFLGAGAVLHGAGTREIDRLGGLQRRMPWTGSLFLVGAAAISGLPPLNGFVSEFLIYLGAFQGAADRSSGAGMLMASFIGIGALALIGGLAAACFTKAYGVVFLGEPRSPGAAGAHETGAAMRWPMGVLAAACAAVGLLPAPVLHAMGPLLRSVTRLPEASVSAGIASAVEPLRMLTVGAGIVICGALVLVWARRRMLAGRPVEATVTWDCGYARPTARMQYTASSYAQPVTALFRLLLGMQTRASLPTGLFPRRAVFHTHAPDVFRERVFRPMFAGIERVLNRLRVLQHGRIQLYVLYIVVTLIALMIWTLG